MGHPFLFCRLRPAGGGCSPPATFAFGSSFPLRYACGPLPLTGPRVGTGPGEEQPRRGQTIIKSAKRIHNRYVFGAYGSIATRLMNDLTEDVAARLSEAAGD